MHPELKTILRRYPAAARPIGAPVALGNAGGASGARLWRFDSGLGPIVARAWPQEGPDRQTLGRIHGWLAEVQGLGFVPVPLAASDGRTIQEAGGRLWELAPWKAGRADLGRPPGRGRLREGFAGLAALHRAWAHHRTVGPSPGLARRVAELEGWMCGGFDALGRALDRAAADPRRDLAGRWRDFARGLTPAALGRLRHAAGTGVPVQPCLRDARPDHLLFEGDRLTGLVDFGAMAVDVVAGDLARLLAEWVGPDRAARAEALAAYEAVRPLDEAEAALIGAFEGSTALLMAGHWARWHYVDGRTFDDPSAVRRGLERGLERLAEHVAVPPRA